MKKVVVVGGGFTGACLAKKLQKRFKVVLIDTKDYYEFTPGVLRTIVDPKHMNKIQIYHKDYIKKGEIILGCVEKITPKEVVVGNKKINFDYLVISSGSKYGSHIKEQKIILPTRAKILNKCNHKLKNSKNILLIGGGIVSVELAAEIITNFKDKKITIVHSHDRLMEKQPFKASKYAEDFLKKRGVKIFFNERVKNTKNNSFVTNKRRKIKSDMPFICTGIKNNSRFIKDSFREYVNEKGQVKVNSYLQFEGFKNIFAGGDVTDVNEEKLAQNAENHAKLIMRNIINLEKGKKLVEYSPSARVMVISLGKYNAILTYKNFTVTGLFPAFMKWFIEKMIMLRYKW